MVELKLIFIYEMDHPTDRHPPLRVRAKNLRIKLSDIKKNDLIMYVDKTKVINSSFKSSSFKKLK